LKLSRQEKAFVQTMMAEYGFDAETAQQLLTIKQGIDKKFPTSSQEFRDYIFLRVVGAANYNDFRWKETAGHLKKYFYKLTGGSSITGKSRTVEKRATPALPPRSISKVRACGAFFSFNSCANAESFASLRAINQISSTFTKSERWRAKSLPIPEDAPVTMAIFFTVNLALIICRKPFFYGGYEFPAVKDFFCRRNRK